MSSDATGTPAGTLELRRLTPEQVTKARAKSQAYNSPLKQELFLAAGGTLADWYACAASPPVETDDERAERNRARLMAACPPGLEPDEVRAWMEIQLRKLAR